MASRDIECIPVPEGPVYQRHDQKDCPDNGHDTGRQERGKLLKSMCITSVGMVIASVLAILIWILGLPSYSGGIKFIMYAGVFAGGMVIFFAVCPICMYYEDKRREEGMVMGKQYKFCLNCMIIYFAFALCAVLIVLGLAGIYGTVECVQAKQEILLSYNLCTENTEAQLIFAILTTATSSVLLILILLVICIFCCNKSTLGYQDIYEYRREDIEEIRRQAREEALRVAGREILLRQQDGGPGVGPLTANPRAPPLDQMNSEEPPPPYEAVVRDEPNSKLTREV